MRLAAAILVATVVAAQKGEKPEKSEKAAGETKDAKRDLQRKLRKDEGHRAEGLSPRAARRLDERNGFGFGSLGAASPVGFRIDSVFDGLRNLIIQPINEGLYRLGLLPASALAELPELVGFTPLLRRSSFNFGGAKSDSEVQLMYPHVYTSSVLPWIAAD